MLHKNWHLGTWASLFCLEHNKQNISNTQGTINEFSWACVDQSSEDLGTCLTNVFRTFGHVWLSYWGLLDLCDQCIENGSMKADHCGLSVSFSKVDDLPIPHLPTRSQWDSKLANSEEMMGAWEDRSKTDLLSSSAGRGTGEGGRTSLNASFR